MIKYLWCTYFAFYPFKNWILLVFECGFNPPSPSVVVRGVQKVQSHFWIGSWASRFYFVVYPDLALCVYYFHRASQITAPALPPPPQHLYATVYIIYKLSTYAVVQINWNIDNKLMDPVAVAANNNKTRSAWRRYTAVIFNLCVAVPRGVTDYYQGSRVRNKNLK
jgi:hypothetical protein